MIDCTAATTVTAPTSAVSAASGLYERWMVVATVRGDLVTSHFPGAMMNIDCYTSLWEIRDKSE